MSTMSALRIAEVERDGVRSARPCLRHLDRYARGEIDGTCKFPPSAKNWRSYRIDNVQTYRCETCLKAGQDCVAPPDDDPEDWAALERDLQRFLAQAFPAGLPEADVDYERAGQVMDAIDTVTVRNRITKLAGEMLARIKEDHTPYHKTLTAHNGQLGLTESAQSGIYLKGRDRSNKGVLKREKRKIEELEADSEPEAALTPVKKARKAFKGRGLTLKEHDEEVKRLAEEAAAAARKKKPAARKPRGGASTRGGSRRGGASQA
ncbi:hypothetical protein N0V91_011385 [Didymella pomorum]|uniref:Uncharacterized protein n=1 Tax=Didymella pomorum TaxID=749634 RepID=A0A9W9CYJ4_9PLEO|nr:hypothetical protein N0V91_011385 [Didymella pomorum]